jgi:uroporphyrinogen decarboxylase
MSALYLEETDRIPLFDFLFNPEIFRKVLGRFPPSGVSDWVECTKRLGLDALWLWADAREDFQLKPADEQGSFYDEWGQKCSVTKEEHWPIPWIADHPLRDIEKLKEYEPPDPFAPGRTRTIEEAVKLAGEDMAILGGLGGPYSNAAMLTGYTTHSIIMYERPSIIHKIAEMITHFNIEVGKRLIDAGVDVIKISDDFGTDESLFISPKHFRIFVFPYLKRMVNAFKKRGVPVSLHSDGNINAILEDIVKTDIDVLHPIERKAHMDIAEIKEKYGEKICLMGNVDATRTLPRGSTEDIVNETKECISAAAPGGGHILASDHSLTGVSVERAKIMFDVGRKYGRYPTKEVKT